MPVAQLHKGSYNLLLELKMQGFMTTMIIEENSVQTRQFIKYARTLPFTKIKREKAKVEPEFNLYESLDSAFADVRLMMDGKKPKKTLDEFLEELRIEEENEKFVWRLHRRTKEKAGAQESLLVPCW